MLLDENFFSFRQFDGNAFVENLRKTTKTKRTYKSFTKKVTEQTDPVFKHINFDPEVLSDAALKKHEHKDTKLLDSTTPMHKLTCKTSDEDKTLTSKRHIAPLAPQPMHESKKKQAKFFDKSKSNCAPKASAIPF
jgi:hypothetical protein